ncbi:ATP-binding protein [Paenibacillus sp. GP183]|uniref:sensor histidine kinase n=1 Tax=Paenibacillus sp. GP183 TaxID=1882751 RepID=UPI00089D2B5D|nr:ATP-binding protein [Paenibacillus sp. GP183]SEC05664.1 His Kinase A (phospho-acceptor) domain-containing protein [Paenibacillus sp. GP183]
MNAIVFILIFYLCVNMLFFYAKFHMYNNVDRRLQDIGNSMKSEKLDVFLAAWDDNRRGDQLIFYVLTDKQGNGYQIPPSTVPYKLVTSVKDRSSSSTESIQTIMTGNRESRVLNIPVTKSTDTKTNIPFYNIINDPIVSVQVVRSLYPEQFLFNELQSIMPIVSISGAVLAILAGFYLAGRALIPILSSWNKQQRFVADASHELRTPLAVMQTNTEMLLRYPKHTIEEESENISVILKEVRRMISLVSDLLTLARSESNQLQIRHQSFLLDETINEMLEQYCLFAEMNNRTIYSDVEKQIPFLGDEERIRQLLVILLDNAIKYTPEQGKITVTCRQQKHFAEISIEDTGMGISKQDLPLIFDRFYRGDKVRSRSQGGYGLGLSIAKWIVEAHKGKIRVESHLGTGTRFILTFPLKKLASNHS